MQVNTQENASANTSANTQENTQPQTTTTTTYGDMVKKTEIAPFLNLQPSDPFDIVSENDRLTMIHYRNDADEEEFGHLRGVVVDRQTGVTVATSYPYSIPTIAPYLALSDGRVGFGDYSIPEDQLRIKIGSEGTLIHVFKHAGQIYRSTRKRLDPGKSRWGNSKTFGDMYWDLGGPQDNDLFSEDKDYSPYCHSFIMVHPDVLVASKEDVGTGYMVYLGPKKMWSTENCPYPLDQVDDQIHFPETVTRSDLLNPENRVRVICPELADLEAANKHLLFGFYEGFEGYENLDPRLLPGEFLILEDTSNGKMYRVESPAYAWRSAVRNNDPNLLHRFYELVDWTYVKEELAFSKMFPVMMPYDPQMIQDCVPVVAWPNNEAEKHMMVPNDREGKLYNIWEAFLMSVPLHRQAEVMGYHEQLVTRRNELSMWLMEQSQKLFQLTLSNFSRRAQDILTKTRSFAEKAVEQGKNIDRRTGKRQSVEEMTQRNIHNFLLKERGASLYRLIREMDLAKNPPVVVNNMVQE